MMPSRPPINQQHPHPLLGSPVISSQESMGDFMPHIHGPIPGMNLSPQDIFHMQQAQVFQAARLRPRLFQELSRNEPNPPPCPNRFPLQQPPPPPAPYQGPVLPPKGFPLVPPPQLPTQPFKHPLPPPPQKQQTVTSNGSPSVSKQGNNSKSIPSDPVQAVITSPHLTLEKELSKDIIGTLLYDGKAEVVFETGKRTRSDVWLYFGRVRLLDCGLFCKDVVACAGCRMVYVYRSKSQGTSTLRHHKCWYVFQMLQEKEIKEQEKLMEEEEHRVLQREKHHRILQRTKQLQVEQMKRYPDTNAPTMDSKNGCQDVPWNLNGLQGEGRHQQRELTPESEDRKPVMPTPPPLKEHIMNSPSPQSVHPVSLHQGTPVSGGGLVNNVGGRSNSSAGGCASPPPPSSKDSPNQQLLCVRWGNFDSNIVSMFSKLRSQEHFIDVTLWCEGKTIKCHKMVLSACSMYFEKLLTEYPNPHPIIFLTDMRFWEIQALVEFMYRGEVSVHQDKLQSLLRAAESLQIKGLGSPSNEMGMAGNGDAQNSMDEDMSNSTMDMTTNSSHNNSNSLHNHIKDDNGPNSNGSNVSGHSLHNSHHILGAAINNNNNNNTNNNQAPWQKLTAAANMMGIDLSNHGVAAGALSLSSLHGGNLPLPLSLSAGSPQSGSGSQGSGCGPASKRRKKETPRRIDLPRTAGMPLPAFNSTMGSEIEEDDDAASEDSMAAHERNHVDGLNSDRQQDQGYGDDEDCDPQENYDENDQGGQGEDEISSDHGEDMDDEHEGALSLRVSNLSDSERERSRKGNPMKKILGIGNNNNNNESGPQNLIHNVTSGGD